MLAHCHSKTKLKFNEDLAFYETDDLKFYYSELVNVEEVVLENEFVNPEFSTEEENPNFTKKSLDVFYHLTFKENNGNIKTYYIDHKPKTLGKKYFYIVQNNKIVRIIYNKKTMIGILDEYYKSEKNFDKEKILDGKFNNFLENNIKTTYNISTIIMYALFFISWISLFFNISSFLSYSLILLSISLFSSDFLMSISNKRDNLVEANRKKEIEELINSL